MSRQVHAATLSDRDVVLSFINRAAEAKDVPVGIDLGTLGFAADETEHELSDYPLCTVPEGVTVTVARPKRHFVKLTTKSNGDGTVTYLADVGVTGCAIILR